MYTGVSADCGIGTVLHGLFRIPAAGGLGVILGACLLLYPDVPPDHCEEFGGMNVSLTIIYTDGVPRQEEWCHIRGEDGVQTAIRKGVMERYPDFVARIN